MYHIDCLNKTLPSSTSEERNHHNTLSRNLFGFSCLSGFKCNAKVSLHSLNHSSCALSVLGKVGRHTNNMKLSNPWEAEKDRRWWSHQALVKVCWRKIQSKSKRHSHNDSWCQKCSTVCSIRVKVVQSINHRTAVVYASMTILFMQVFAKILVTVQKRVSMRYRSSKAHGYE